MNRRHTFALQSSHSMTFGCNGSLAGRQASGCSARSAAFRSSFQGVKLARTAPQHSRYTIHDLATPTLFFKGAFVAMERETREGGSSASLRKHMQDHLQLFSLQHCDTQHVVSQILFMSQLLQTSERQSKMQIICQHWPHSDSGKQVL